MIMNRINIENKKIFLNPGVNYLYITKEIKLEIISNFNSKLIIIGNNNYSINIILNENSKLVVNSINRDNSVNINIKLNKDSSMTYNHSVVSKKDSDNKFNISHSSNTLSILNNNGINLNDNKLFFEINGIIDKKLVNVNCSQSSKIINYSNGFSKIIPNLIIDSNDIIANHAAYIGKINKDEEFYFESRGINKEIIKKLIYEATMLGKMDLDKEKEEFNQIINEWW